MKFILFNINDTNKNEVKKIELDETHYINEVSLSKGCLDLLSQQPKGIIAKLKYSIKDKNIEKKILKALESYDKKWYFILSKTMQSNKYLANKIESLLGYKLTPVNELNYNIFKYIDEYLEENKNLKKHGLKMLLVANTNKNLNFKLLENLINEYKSVNIYLNEKPSAYTLKKIKGINKNEGTTIEIVKKERKVVAEYNVVYFIDDAKGNYPRLRIDKNALIIDVDNIYNDKFNSSIIFMKDYMINNKYKSNIDTLIKEYELLELSGIVRKIVNELDKS